MIVAPPVVRLALPGEWLQVPVNDAARVERLIELLEQDDKCDPASVAAFASALRDLAAGGGDQIYFRQDATAPTLLVTAWPSTADEPSGASSSSEGLRTQLGHPDDATDLPRGDGYVAIRVPLAKHRGAFGASYWIRHPASGRVLGLTVARFGIIAPPLEQLLYDVIARAVTWDEPGTPHA